jgi:hypothetical protein
MKEAVSLNDNIQINLPKLIESKLLVQANSGGGKSWALRRILEQSHGKVQHIILDSEGEFGTLREKYDYVLAGKDGDTPAEPRSAALLARKLLELNVSAIIDLYELHPQERKRFVIQALFPNILTQRMRINGNPKNAATPEPAMANERLHNALRRYRSLRLAIVIFRLSLRSAID